MKNRSLIATLYQLPSGKIMYSWTQYHKSTKFSILFLPLLSLVLLFNHSKYKKGKVALLYHPALDLNVQATVTFKKLHQKEQIIQGFSIPCNCKLNLSNDAFVIWVSITVMRETPSPKASSGGKGLSGLHLFIIVHLLRKSGKELK